MGPYSTLATPLLAFPLLALAAPHPQGDITPSPFASGFLYQPDLGCANPTASADFDSTGSCYTIPRAGKWGFESGTEAGPLDGQPKEIVSYYTVYAGPGCQGEPIGTTDGSFDCMDFELGVEASYYICRVSECHP
ncbi:MAG: hypothetical protein Q9169_007478 [Polycauliona sp. 2 TL-2023]